MKKLYASVTGIEQGAVQLFSDFADDGPMWSGTGAREAVVEVLFSKPFKNEPSVQISLQMIDAKNSANLRYDLSPFDIREESFKIRFKTWSDTQIARAVASWIAIGEAPGEGDWEV